MKVCLFLALLFAAALPASAQQTPQQLADAELPSLLTIYKDIHTHPELSTRSSGRRHCSAKELKAASCGDVTENVGKYKNADQKCYGVIGLLKNGDGADRYGADSDLTRSVQEETGLPYASKVTTKNEKGDEVHVMHACGHDAHVSIPLNKSIDAFIGKNERSMA